LEVLAADRRALRAAGLRDRSIDAIATGRSRKDAERECSRLKALGAGFVCWTDSRYPRLLQEIADPPPALFYRGDPELFTKPSVAVVGARAASNYGIRAAEHIGTGLARAGWVVISGLALGIDSSAHRGALSGPGTTIAVLGCGCDVVYPRQNTRLYDTIVRQGLVVSEYPCGTSPEPFRFPARNRIISGLALGVVVIEAAKRSGSLITARLALEQNREVFAVPGSIDSPKSDGTHRLIQQGAKLVRNAEDILEEFGHLDGGVPPRSEDGIEKGGTEELHEGLLLIFRNLEDYPRSIEEIIAASGVEPSRVIASLAELEIMGLAQSLPGPAYQRSLQGTKLAAKLGI